MLFTVVLLLVSAGASHAASVGNTKTKGIVSGMDIIRFPDEQITRLESKPAKLQASLENKFGNNEVPESCKQQTFCTIRPPNYPDKKFNDMFKDYKIPPMPAAVDHLGNRQGDPAYKNDCDSIVTYEPIYQLRPKRDEDAWRTVVQAPEHGYVQQVRLETCENVKKPCFEQLVFDNVGYQTSCEQMYSSWELMVAKLDGNGTERIKADLPSCCSCKYKVVKIAARFGGTTAHPASNKTKA